MICLLGPTGSGKTALVLELAAVLPIDIISVDSALVYRQMNIGTAKPDPATLARIPHHLIDICDPATPYSAAQFCTDAHRLIQQSMDNARIPLLTGGTMLYYRSLWEGLSPLPSADQSLRASLSQQAETKGWAYLHQTLQAIDPRAAERIHANDAQRIQRALEVYYLTGKTLSDFIDNTPKSPPPAMLKLVISPSDRQILHERISARLDGMLAQGFIEEVAALRRRGDLTAACPAMRAVGYRQIWSYLVGEQDYVTMREKALIATRQLAKHQLTWLRQFEGVIWFDSTAPDLFSQVYHCIQAYLEKKGKKATAP